MYTCKVSFYATHDKTITLKHRPQVGEFINLRDNAHYENETCFIIKRITQPIGTGNDYDFDLYCE